MEILSQALPLDEHQYAIIDQALIGRFPMADYPCLSLAPEKGQHQAHLYPVLLDLTSMEVLERDALFKVVADDVAQGYAPVCAMFLQTVKTGYLALSEHLKKHLFLTVGGRSYLSRFYDPNVLKQLNWLMDDAYLSHLSGPILAWTFYQNGQIYTLAKIKDTYLPEIHYELLLEQFLLINLINKVVKRSGCSLSLTDNEAYSFKIRQYLHEGERLGLRHEDDLVHFACHCELLPDGFAQYSIFQEILSKCRQSKSQSYIRLYQEELEKNRNQMMTDLNITDQEIMTKVIYG